MSKKQEPIGYWDGDTGILDIEKEPNNTYDIPLYTHPKEWQGLTKEDIEECESKSEWIIDNHIDHEDFAKQIEQKLKEKNT